MAQIGKKILSNASIFYIFPLNIVSLTIGANIGSCPRTTPPSPTAFFHFAPLSRVVTSHWARAIAFLIICSHFDHDGLENSARGHSVYLQRRGKTRNEMVIPKDLKSFLQALSV